LDCKGDPRNDVFFEKLCRTQRQWASQSCVKRHKIRIFGSTGAKIHRFWGLARAAQKNALQFTHPRWAADAFSNFSPIAAKLPFASRLSALCFAIVMPYLCGIR
jgi:hypothetical protein